MKKKKNYFSRMLQHTMSHNKPHHNRGVLFSFLMQYAAKGNNMRIYNLLYFFVLFQWRKKNHRENWKWIFIFSRTCMLKIKGNLFFHISLSLQSKCLFIIFNRNKSSCTALQSCLVQRLTRAFSSSSSLLSCKSVNLLNLTFVGNTHWGWMMSKMKQLFVIFIKMRSVMWCYRMDMVWIAAHSKLGKNVVCLEKKTIVSKRQREWILKTAMK